MPIGDGSRHGVDIRLHSECHLVYVVFLVLMCLPRLTATTMVHPNRWSRLSFLFVAGRCLNLYAPGRQTPFRPFLLPDLRGIFYVEPPFPFLPLQLLYNRDTVAGKRVTETVENATSL